MSCALQQFDSYKITLMRHGPPLLPKLEWIAPGEMERWIHAYNRAEVATKEAPASCLQVAISAAYIISSPAPRALTTVRALGQEADEVCELFSEAALPTGNWSFPCLPAELWVVWFRALWFLGYARDVESVDAARRRVVAAARKLADRSIEGEVLLVGHGIINRLVGAELASMGWVKESSSGHGYWGHTRYHASARAMHELLLRKQAQGRVDHIETNCKDGLLGVLGHGGAR